MDTMIPGEKDITDVRPQMDISIKDTSFVLAYPKINKLITALYMVTDVMDMSEPLRLKLRTLGVGIISDTLSNPADAPGKISEVLSFLDIGRAVNLISEMNHAILKKEFTELKNSIEKSREEIAKPVALSHLFTEHESLPEPLAETPGTRIGVQKGSTLLAALKQVSDRVEKPAQSTGGDKFAKKDRREKITEILKQKGGLPIKDIFVILRSYKGQEKLSEKTLQRELLAMLREKALDRVGSKRWSKYFVK